MALKILFTADIHIKLGQKNVPVDWAKNRFNMFIEQFAEMQKQADLIVIGGDIFDRLPNMDEVELYFDLIASINKKCLIYPGNHEMIKKDTTFLTYLKRSTERLNPLIKIVNDYHTEFIYPTGGPGLPILSIVPYNKLKEYEKESVEFHSRILCTHVRGEIPPHVKPEVNLDIFDKFDIVLAGDLHSYENSQRNILYPGSPYTTSFHRNEVRTGAILLDSSDISHDWLEFNLPQLIKKTVGVTDPKPQTPFHHTIYEVEGDLSELGSMEDSELIDKKVVKRSQDTQLILDPNMSLAEEVREYLSYILMLPEDTIEETIKEYYSYADKLEA